MPSGSRSYTGRMTCPSFEALCSSPQAIIFCLLLTTGVRLSTIATPPQPMRHATPLFVICVVLASCAPTRLAADTEYQEVREVEALSADQIYERSLLWMAERFNSANDAIQIRDDEDNRLVANASVYIPGKDVNSDMGIIVEAREGRFRFTARNFGMQVGSFDSYMTPELYEELKPELQALASELQSYVRGESEDADW